MASTTNNHILDFGRLGLVDTLTALHGAGLKTAGAGRTREQARAPVEVPLPGGGRLVVFAFGHESSGVARAWAATDDSPGVAQLPDLTGATAEQVGVSVAAAKAGGAVVVVSLHWGSNWGYAVPKEQVRFAHRLVDAGADIVHGHSSHHPRPIEVYGGRLIFYGCGDLINDYEGIGGTTSTETTCGWCTGRAWTGTPAVSPSWNCCPTRPTGSPSGGPAAPTWNGWRSRSNAPPTGSACATSARSTTG